jgi:hypothetical protein
MTPEAAAFALLKSLNLPEGAANVLTWHETNTPTLRVWVEERYIWHARRIVPQDFEGFHVDIEVRPIATAHKAANHIQSQNYPIPAMTATELCCAEPNPDDDAFMYREMSDEEFEVYVRASNDDLPSSEVTFFLPEFA